MRDYNECRPYLDHLRAEHRHLHALLRRLRNSVPSNEELSGPLPGAVTTLLAEMRAEMSHHFADEEGGGCMEEAVSRFPSLSAEALRIEAEHPRLLAEFDRLIARAGQLETAGDRRPFREAMEDFVDHIQAHEHAESELLRRGFGSDYDIDENGIANPSALEKGAGA